MRKTQIPVILFLFLVFFQNGFGQLGCGEVLKKFDSLQSDCEKLGFIVEAVNEGKGKSLFDEDCFMDYYFKLADKTAYGPNVVMGFDGVYYESDSVWKEDMLVWSEKLGCSLQSFELLKIEDDDDGGENYDEIFGEPVRRSLPITIELIEEGASRARFTGNVNLLSVTKNTALRISSRDSIQKIIIRAHFGGFDCFGQPVFEEEQPDFPFTFFPGEAMNQKVLTKSGSEYFPQFFTIIILRNEEQIPDRITLHLLKEVH